MKPPVGLLYCPERSLKNSIVGFARSTVTHGSPPYVKGKQGFPERLDDGGRRQVQSFREFCALQWAVTHQRKPDQASFGVLQLARSAPPKRFQGASCERFTAALSLNIGIIVGAGHRRRLFPC